MSINQQWQRVSKEVGIQIGHSPRQSAKINTLDPRPRKADFPVMDLGTKPEPIGNAEPSAPETPKIQYPSFTLRDEKVDELKTETGHDCAVDDFYTAEVRLRVSAVSNDDMGQRIEFEVQELNDLEPEGAADDEGGEPASENPGDSGKPAKTPK